MFMVLLSLFLIQSVYTRFPPSPAFSCFYPAFGQVIHFGVALGSILRAAGLSECTHKSPMACKVLVRTSL